MVACSQGEAASRIIRIVDRLLSAALSENKSSHPMTLLEKIMSFSVVEADNLQSGEVGLLDLKKHVVFNAIHHLSERPLHRMTRKTILGFIMNWIKNPDSDHDVLWLRAPFGHGKTAVMQQIAASLSDSSLSDYAGSFFFSRGETGRDRAQHLIPTLAYQIALNIPGMRQQINQAMTHDFTLPSKNMKTQLQRLILDPFRRCSPPLSNKPVVIIDALDECTGLTQAQHPSNQDDKRAARHEAQRCILDIIVQAVSSPHCPLRFLISSRPEHELKVAFRRKELCQVSSQIELDGDQSTNSPENRLEMMAYLRDRFSEIYDHFLNVMSTVEKPWPSHDDLWELVRQASGQYLFANSVLHSVESCPESPVNQLKIILKQQHREKRRAFATMDHGYTQILTAGSGPRQLQRILDIFAYLYGWENTLTLSTLAEILDCPAGDVIISFYGLNALLDIDEYNDMPADTPKTILLRYYVPHIHVRHISFIEFLLDGERSGRFHVDIDTVRLWVMERADILLADGLSGRAQFLLHETTSKLIAWLAVADTRSNDHKNNKDEDTNIDRFPHFPRLRQFLETDSPSSFSVPDHPGKRFVESILTVLSIFDSIHHKAFQNYVPICHGLLDQVWPKTISYSARFQKIVFTIMTHSDLCPHISMISDALGTPLHEALDILDQYCCFTIRGHQVELLEHFRSFSETESRSGPLHFHYRECWIRAISAHWREVLQQAPKFTLNSYSYLQLFEGFYEIPTISDINFGGDLREDGAMSDLIEFVPEIPTGGVPIISENDYSVDVVCLFVRWLVRQQKILQSADEKYSIIARKLQAIIKTIDWNWLIYGVFSVSLHPIQDTTFVPPLAIERIPGYNRRTRRAVKFYSCMSQLANSTAGPLKEDGISVISHTTISEFFLHALFAREHRNIGIDEWRTIYVPILISVQWDYHLSRAMFTEKILLGILTVHHIFSQREDPTASNQERLALGTMKQLTQTFAEAVITWLKNHTREGNNLEWWAKGMPGMKQGRDKDSTASIGNHDSASNNPSPSNHGNILFTPIRSKRKKAGSSSSKAAGAQANVPSTLMTTTNDGNSEPIAKRLRSITRAPKQASRLT